MNKQKLVELIKHPTQIGSTELKSIETLAANFPYCQFLKALSARGHKNSQTEQQSKRIALAAAYTTNRSILKQFMEAQVFPATETLTEQTFTNNKEGVAPSQLQKQYVSEEEEAEAETAPQTAVNEPQVKEPEESKEQTLEEEDQKPEEESDKITYTKPAEEDKKDEIYKEIQANLEKLRKQRSILNTQEEQEELAEENLDKDNKSKDKRTEQDQQEETQYYIPEEEEDKIIAELSNKKEVTKDQLQMERQKQQYEIINRFIETNPSINRFGLNNKPDQEKQEDLSEKLFDTGSQLVSENLAIILTKQNKIEKAIDIYKKLIWKFPQKKAYFAQKIEELKNT